MHDLDVAQLRTFLAVEAAGSFTGAGEAVAKTQSAVSVHIKKLEQQLGVRLFQRGRGRVALTAEGRRLLPHARIIVETSREALAAFDPSALRGEVRLGTADDYAERYLPAILAGFSRAHPLVEVSVLCAGTYALSRAIDAGELDVAVVTHNESDQPSELLRVEPLFWVTSARHDTHREAVVPLALGSQYCSWRRQALSRLERLKRPHRLLYASSSATVVSSAVLSGLAVSVLPESAVRPDMRVLDKEDGFPALSPCEIGVTHGARRDDPLVVALVDHIRASLEVLAPRTMTARPEEVPLAQLMEIAGPRKSARGLLSAADRAN